MKKNNHPDSQNTGSKAKPSPLDEFIAELRPGQSIDLLKSLHILTREGKLNQDSRRKLKQITHLYQFIEKALLSLPEGPNGLTVADLGAGKSYLGFLIYDLFFKNKEKGQMIGIETRIELVEKSKQLALELGFKGMIFADKSVQEAMTDSSLPQHIDVITALHACDSATDDAIEFGLVKKSKYMILVPCCQAEVAAVLRQNRALSVAKTSLGELWRHPLHTRELGSQITNVLRCLYLEALGYQVTVTELVGWEHSMKNELIVAKYTGQKKPSSAQHLKELLHQFSIDELLNTRFKRLPVDLVNSTVSADTTALSSSIELNLLNKRL
jgi:hypothetical protein